MTYKEIELKKKAIHHFFLVFSSKLYNPQNQLSPYSNLTKVDISVKYDSIGVIYIYIIYSLYMSILDKFIIEKYTTYMTKLNTLHISILIKKHRLE